MKEINLIKLVVVVFFISWIGVLPSLLIAYGLKIPNYLKLIEILMILGPLLGACIFLYLNKGKRGIKNFFKKLLQVQASFKVVAIAVFFPVVWAIFSPLIGFAISGTSWPSSFDLASITTNALLFFIMYLIINTEELVWRGIVFDRLYNRHGYVKACLIISPIWWLFHIPLFLYPQGHQAGYGITEFTIIVVSQSFILGWIYIKSNRSLFYTHIHHQLLNGLGQAFPIFPILIGGDLLPFRVACFLMALMAVILVFTTGKHKTITIDNEA